MSGPPHGARGRGLRIAALAVVAVLVVDFAWSLPAVHGVRLNDFPAYWASGRVVLEGQPERLYSTEWKWYTNLPVVALLLAPLGALEYATAWELFWWGSVACFAATFALLLWTVARWFPPLDPASAAVVALVFFAFAPVMRRCLVLGQTTPLMVLLFAVVYVLARAGRDRSAGALLGVICLIKIPPLILLPLLAVRRRLAMAGAAALVVALGVVLSFAIFGAELVGQYADRVIWDNFGRAQAAFNNQGLDGAWMRILSDRGLADWVPVPRPPALVAAVYGTWAALALGLLACGRGLLWPARPPPDGDPQRGSLELEIGLGVALMCLLFPVVWIHYYLFLVVPLCLLPLWFRQRGLARATPASWVTAGLFVAGVVLASGFEVHENAWYAERSADPGQRLALNARPLGALLLVASFAWPLREASRWQRAEDSQEAAACG